VAYVLRGAFDYSYCEIAKILKIEEGNSRQTPIQSSLMQELARWTLRTENAIPNHKRSVRTAGTQRD
jgi:hypothetical protein